MEDRAISELDELALGYAEVRDQRIALQLQTGQDVESEPPEPEEDADEPAEEEEPEEYEEREEDYETGDQAG